MSRVTIIVIALTVVILGFLYFSKGEEPKEPLIGTKHKVQGRDHIAQGAKHKTYNSDPASSGAHYADLTAPAQWGFYNKEVVEEIFIHNQEHGGVVVTYKPDLPKDDLNKLKKLFLPPYSGKDFRPSKAIVTPRQKNSHAIQMASWGWTMNLAKYDEAKITKFYLQHSGKAPEPQGGPGNQPEDFSSEE